MSDGAVVVADGKMFHAQHGMPARYRTIKICPPDIEVSKVNSDNKRCYRWDGNCDVQLWLLLLHSYLVYTNYIKSLSTGLLHNLNV